MLWIAAGPFTLKYTHTPSAANGAPRTADRIASRPEPAYRTAKSKPPRASLAGGAAAICPGWSGNMLEREYGGADRERAGGPACVTRQH
jgi:hypothetical protein